MKFKFDHKLFFELFWLIWKITFVFCIGIGLSIIPFTLAITYNPWYILFEFISFPATIICIVYILVMSVNTKE